MLREERRRRLARAHDRMRDEPAQEREVRLRPLDLGLGERARQQLERLLPVVPVRDQLRDHRVVREPDLVALLDARIHPQARRSSAA